MFFERVYDEGLSHASYVVGCQTTGEALVLDPRRDVDTYLAIAHRERLAVTHVAETHIHADLLSGSRELAALTGAKMLLSDEGGPDWQYDFEHVGVRDGDRFMVGNLRFDVLHTPGHTPEHVSYLLTDTPAGDAPLMLFTGDFVFVGDVGRPDLLEKAAGLKDAAALGAQQMWTSLSRFRELPEFVQVWPAHGAGSACGKALGAVPSSTIGYEKATSWVFRERDEAAFVRELLAGQPEPPVYFAEMKKRNRTARPLMTSLPSIPRLSIDELDAHVAKGAVVVDTRSKADFGRGHLPGSLHIQSNRAFSTWSGWLLAYDAPIVLVSSPIEVERIVRALVRIGLDGAVGYLAGVDAWREAGRRLDTVREMDPRELAARLENDGVVLVDVRSTAEHRAERIAAARHIHLGELAALCAELPRAAEVVLHCQGGDRSSTALSVLARTGFENVAHLAGGLLAWRRAGLETVSGAGGAV